MRRPARLAVQSCGLAHGSISVGSSPITAAQEALLIKGFFRDLGIFVKAVAGPCLESLPITPSG